MALTATVSRKLAEIKTIHLYGTLAFSGTYATGGEVYDIAAIAGFGNKQPIAFQADGLGDYLYRFDYTNKKIKINLVSTGAELGAGAYPGGVTGDVIHFHAVVPKG